MFSFLAVSLFLLHPGSALISETKVQLGEPGTLTCLLPNLEYSNIRIKWYKQSLGDTLVLITTLMKATASPTFEKGFSSSRFHANYTSTMSTLTILKTVPEDEAVYHCAITTWTEDHWSGVYLTFEGNSQRTSNFTVVQWPTVSHQEHLRNSMSLQCSLLPDPKKTLCPSEHSVRLFGVRSNPNIIYTDENKQDECDKMSDVLSAPKSCIYRFSEDVGSSDTGTYYCAVATCGEILSGNGTNQDIKGPTSSPFILKEVTLTLLLLCGVSVICVVIMVLLLCGINKGKCDYCSDKAAVSLQENAENYSQQRDGDTWIYSTVIFTMKKTSGGGMR
ncbi:uncharacterized protein LOC116696559 [Xyrichtys novacula]|uniref:Uncharacterized protein LOC116696559 n=1 Tax=Xyrichtys novacula TaxID=13765 RepID=A0AAV1FD46_XYRNO|nr:uncharacterized protein LOC116696559 [Xyrichtys novacula]